MEKVREAQERLATPYVMLSGSVKAGQVSDSRSVYATMDQEAPGLTPLLAARGAEPALAGARKVEFFNKLGAGKGRARSGADADMAPPPPKRPKNN